MSGVYLDVRAASLDENWQNQAWLAQRQIQLIENSLHGYMRLYFPDSIAQTEILQYIENLVLQASKQWCWQDYGKHYCQLLSPQRYAQMQLRVEKMQEQEETLLRNAFRQDLQQILNKYGQINIDGYLQFSAVKWKRLIQNLIYEIYLEVEEEIEQEEFVALLQYVIQTQPSLLDKVYLLLTADGHFQLKDEFGHDLREEYLLQIYPEELAEVGEIDLLMSILVTLLPQEIYVHVEDGINMQQFELLQQVFGKRLIYW